MQLKIKNKPRSIPLQEYESEIARYLEQIDTACGVVSVMTMGSIKAPGLSDIDLICVVEDDFLSQYSPQLSTKNLRDDLFLHGPVVIPSSLLSSLQHIIYASNLQTIWGDDTHKLAKIPEAEIMKLLSLAYVIDFSESRFGQYAAVKKNQSLDMRKWMTRLWSLVHTRKLCSVAGVIISDQSLSTIDRIVKLRHGWLAGDRCSEAEFCDIFLKSEMVLQEIFSTACMVAAKYIGPVECSHTKIFTSRNKRIVCSHACERPVSTIIDVPGLPRLLTSTTPASYATYLSQYQKGKISANQTSNILVETLQMRRRLVAKLHDFHQEKQLLFSMGGYLGLSVSHSRSRKELLYRLIWKCTPVNTGTAAA